MHKSGHIIAFLVLITGLTGCGSGEPHENAPARIAPATTAGRAITQVRQSALKPIATIGGTIITRAALEHWVLASTHAQVEVPEPPEYGSCVERLRSIAADNPPPTVEELKDSCRRQYDALMKPALSSLIHANWLIGEAAELGLTVDRAKLKRASALDGPRSAEVRQILANTREKPSDIQLKLMLSQLSDRIYRKLERKVPAITGARIAEYYRLHGDSFAVPERRDLYVARLGSLAAANKAKREIERGASFATILENTELMQPHEAHGGLIHGLEPNNWPEQPLSRDIFHAPLKALEGPVQISLGFYVFKVVRKVPPQQRALAEVKPEVVKQLHLTLRDRVVSRFVAAFRNRWTSRTSCLPGYVVQNCRQFKFSRASLREAPNTL